MEDLLDFPVPQAKNVSMIPVTIVIRNREERIVPEFVLADDTIVYH